MSLTRSQVLYILVSLLTLTCGQNLERETCDASRREVDVEMTNANAVIGGLFEIRNPLMGGYACGQPHKELIQVYEAARWALKKINDLNYIPGIKLGMKAYETCFSQSVAINAVEKFYPQLSNFPSSCADGNQIDLGILGPMSSWIAKTVASVTSSLPASVLSPRAMSIGLSDKSEYPYFMRTVPTSNSQSRAMLAALDTLSWKKILVVYTDSVYGTDGYDTFMREAYKKGICIAKAISIPSSGSVADVSQKLSNIMNYDVKAAVFLGSYVNALKLFSAMEGIVSGGQIQWMLSDLNLMESYTSSVARGAITVVPKTVTVTEFRDYFLNLNENNPHAENPWFSEWYMTNYNCRLNNVNYAPYNSLPLCGTLTISQKQAAYKQVPFVETTIKAVYAYATALRNAQSARCGAAPSTFCASLQAMTTSEFHNYLRNVNFQFTASENIPTMIGQTVDFDNNGDIITQDFTIFNYNNRSGSGFTFAEVGNYMSGVLNMNLADVQLYDVSRSNPLPNVPSTSCPAPGCMYCEIPRDMVDFLYMPGDVVIAGIVNAHMAGSEAFSCGNINSLGQAEAVAFNYAIRTAKTALPGILTGISLGSLVADICGNGHVGRLFLNNVLGGRHVVRDGSGRIVDAHAIKAMVDGVPNNIAEEFSEGFSVFGVPEIASVATSIRLADTNLHPQFTRALPGNDKLAIALVNLLGNMEWTYIQTVQTENYFGGSVAILREIASIAKICVAASHTLDSDTSYSQVLSDIRSKPDARVVVLFVEQMDIRGLLAEAKAMGLTGSYIFIGTDTWGSRQSSVAGLEDAAHGSIILEPQTVPIAGFRNWVNSLDPRTADDVPGFKEWYQLTYNCYVDADAKGDYPSECGSGMITNSPLYEEPYPISYMINSVYAVAKALDETLKYYCGATYSGVCIQFRSNPAAMGMLNQYLHNVSFIGESSTLFQIREGEGTSGYNILNYRQNSGYANVGSYSVQDGLFSLSKGLIQFPSGVNPNGFESQCSGNCMECSYVASTNSVVLVPGDIQIGGSFAIHGTDSDDSFSCGTLRTVNGVQFLTAVTYAIEQVNSKMAPVSLNGISLGTMLFDHCNVFGRSRDLVTSLYAGLLLTSPTNPHSRALDTRNIKAWLVDNTVSAVHMKDVAKNLNMPLISPFSSSEPLSNREEFPTYFRTVEGDITLSVALAKLLQSLNFHFISVVYSDDDYGRYGMSTFEMVASQEKLCILQSFRVGGSTTVNDIMQNIVISTSHVVIMWTNGADSVAMFQARNQNINADNILFVFPMPVMSLAEAYGAGGKSFMLNIKTGNVPGYENYLSNLATPEGFQENPFLAEYYMAIYSCNLPGVSTYSTTCPTPLRPITDNPSYAQDNYVVPTINAVYAFTAGLDSLLKETCGPDYDGLCTEFLTMDNMNEAIMEMMEGISFIDPNGQTFQFLDREGNMGLDLYYYNGVSTSLVGDIAGASLQLTDSTLKNQLARVSSACLSDPCTICLNNIKTFNFTYKEGDILLGGIFDVHVRDLTPFSCGDLKTLHGFQLLEAFNYAIDRVNDKSGMFANVLKNVRLGGVALDSCESSIRTGYLVSNIHNGLTKLTRNSQTVNPDNINMYVAAYSSDSSIYLARILKALKIPQISYASSSTQLLDTIRYPYFMRAVPTDDRQVEGIVKFLDKFDLRYVQVIYKRDNYGELASESFMNIASQYKICVAQTLAFPDNGSITRESANEIVTGMLEQPNANTVVVFASTDYITGLVDGIRRNPNSHGKFHFVGSETWGNNMEAIAGNEELVEGAVTLTLESADISDFDIYLGSKSPGNYPENPWFPEFYEEMLNCYLTVPNGKHTKQCTSISENIVAQRDYIQDPGILHVINSVYAAAYLIDKTLKETCGSNYTTVCEKYRNSQNRHDLLMSYIDDVEFTDPTNTEFRFTDRREGNKGYQIYSLNRQMTQYDEGYSYDQIGQFSSAGELSIEGSYMPSWDGSCDRQDSCTECPTVRNTVTRYWAQPSTNPNAATVLLISSVNDQTSDPYRCEPLDYGEMYIVFSFMYAIERLTPKPFDVRGLVLDKCSSNLRIDQDLYSLLATGELCSSTFTPGGIVDNSTIAGVITPSSTTTVAVNRVLKPLKMPILSGAATSVLLSDQSQYPYFARTVPPDDQQMETIAEILAANDWTYVTSIYSREAYGISANAQLREASRVRGVCIGSSISTSENPTLDEAKTAIQEVAAIPGARVVVLATFRPAIMLQAAKELGLLEQFIWIGADTWARSMTLVEGIESSVVGAITIDLRSAVVLNYIEYVKEITYSERKNMPTEWFEAFYQRIHSCQLIDAQRPMTEYNNLCTKSEVITNDMVSAGSSYILHMISATYALVKGLNNMATGPCNTSPTFGSCFSDIDNWDVYFSEILKTNWKMQNTLSLNPQENFDVVFNDERFVDIGYNVYTFVKDGPDYKYQKIGSQTETGFTFDGYVNPKGPGFTSKCPEGAVCNCDVLVTSPQALTSNRTEDERFTEPRNYFFYNERINENGQRVFDQVYTWPIWAIAVGVLTCAGLFVSILLFIYFLAAYPVRGGTTILGFMVLIGIIGIYAINFAFFLPASDATCGARRFVMGVVYAIVFAALLVKALDNWRYSDMEYSVRKYKGLTSACSLFMVALGIVLVEAIIPIMWLILVRPTASLYAENMALDDWAWCDPHDLYDRALVMSMIFVMFLVIITGIAASLAWDSDSNYYESRWIFVSSVCTAGCFLVWMIVSTNAGPPFRDPAVALGNFVNATALLICIPIRKLVLLCYVKTHEDTDKIGQIGDERVDVYSTVYSNQGYEGDMFQPVESKHSSDIGFENHNL